MRSIPAVCPGFGLAPGPSWFSRRVRQLPGKGPIRRCCFRLFVLWALWAALLGAARPGPAMAAQGAQQGQELLAAVPADLPPLFTSAQDGSPAGFAVEVMREMAARAGYRLVFVTAASPWEALLLVERGQAHVAPGLGISPGRSTRFAFTRPIDTQPVHIYFRKGGPPREDLASLAGARVSLVSGSIPMERLGEQPGMVVHGANSLREALLDLTSGNTDALVFQSPLAEKAARAAGLGEKLARSRQPVFEVGRAIAVGRDHPEVLARLDQALQAYRDTREFHELYAMWHAEPRPPLLPPEAWWLLAGGLALMAGGMLTWRYVSLWRMNHRLLAALTERDQALGALRFTQERMEALFTLTSMSSPDTGRLIQFALDEGVRLTGSEMGYLFLVDGDTIDLSRVHWSTQGKRPACMPQRQAYPLSEAGLWAECLRTQEPCVVNDYAAHPGRNCLPEGHMPVRRFMAVPLVENGQAVAVLGVANKPGDYDANDTRQLQLFLVGLWRVLAARRDAESIRQAKEYAESLIEGANVMLVGLDREGRTTLFNAAAEGITGFARAEVLGRDWCETMLPGHLAEGAAALYRDFMAGRTALPRQAVGLLRTRDGQERNISWQNSLLRQGGEVMGIIAFGIDITEQRQAEAELRRLHRAIEQAAEGVLIADQSGVILYANPAFERMTGQERARRPLKGCSVFDMDVSVLDHHSSALQGEGAEGTWRGTCAFARPGGLPTEVEFAVSSMRSPDDRFMSYVAVCRDVTEKRLLEHQLWQAQKMEALGTLAGGIAHDFNNLLASIMGFTELAMDDLPAEARSRACLERVLGASLRARELVRRILSFSRRSEHKLRHLSADVSVAEALKLLEASLAKNIEIQSELGSGATILADPSQVHQVVMNLCTNAAQAMQGQGGLLVLRTSAGPLTPELASRHRLSPGDYFNLQVEDQGPGIVPDVLGRIFDPFFTTKGPGEGTGLGLAVVHGIVMSLGGAVWVESEPGQGARFSVLLPAQSGVVEQPGPGEPEDMHGHGRILLVDDEPDILELGGQALSPLGYQVSVEGDPEAALRLLQAAPQAYDLLITDMNMPRLTGLQLAEALAPLRPDLPIVLITGFSKSIPPDRLEVLASVRLLSKPFSTGELAQAVRQALAQPTGGEQ